MTNVLTQRNFRRLWQRNFWKNSMTNTLTQHNFRCLWQRSFLKKSVTNILTTQFKMPLTTQILKEFGDELLDNTILDAFDNLIFERIWRRTSWQRNFWYLWQHNFWRSSMTNILTQRYMSVHNTGFSKPGIEYPVFSPVKYPVFSPLKYPVFSPLKYSTKRRRKASFGWVSGVQLDLLIKSYQVSVGKHFWGEH